MKPRLMRWAVCGIVALFGAGGTPCALGHTPRVAARLGLSTSSPASTPTATLTITKVVLERVPGGPAYSWQTERIVLRRPGGGDLAASAAFARLSRSLETSGFFSRRSGYVDPARLFPGDMGHLMIKVVRGGRVAQVWSYNGGRDTELSETEVAIHRADTAMRHLREKHRAN